MLHDAVGLPGVKVYLHKCIPTGSGLGGGSSDGASMLLLLNRMFSLGLSDCELDRLALKLGSDCPFFLNPVPSFARGRGEQLVQSGVSLRGMYLLLFHPGTGISTGPAYRHVRVAPPEVALERMELMPVSQWKGVFRNVFEPYAFEQQPLIGRIREVLYESGAAFASMTGSGSAVYGLFDRDPEIAAEISPYFIRKENF
jgi:4-diphosphocytidyl-2-C-methyl-D-erythritol kinase